MAMPYTGPRICFSRYHACPDEGATKPAIILNNVDFPDPDFPKSATISPSCSLKFTLSNTNKSWCSAFLKDLLMACSSMITDWNSVMIILLENNDSWREYIICAKQIYLKIKLK